MWKKYLVFCIFGFSLLIHVSCKKDKQPIEPISVNAKSVETVLTMEGSSLHGITANNDKIYFCKDGKYIYEWNFKDEPLVVVEIAEAQETYVHGYGQTFLYDMSIAKDGSFYAAAENRVIRFTLDGTVVVITESFSGTYGAAGIEIADNGSLYISDYGGKLYQYNISTKERRTVLEKSDNADDDMYEFHPVGLTLSPDDEHLYICDRELNRLIVYNTKTGKIESKIRITTLISPEYSFIYQDKLFIKSPTKNMYAVFDISTPSKPVERYSIATPNVKFQSYGIQTSICRIEENELVLYGTNWDTGELYRIVLDNI